MSITPQQAIDAGNAFPLHRDGEHITPPASWSQAAARGFLHLLSGLSDAGEEIGVCEQPERDEIKRIVSGIIDQAYQDHFPDNINPQGDSPMSATQNLEAGSKFPYDQPDDVDAPVPATDWAHAAARGVLSNLRGRGGIGNELEQLDEELRQEIISEAAEVIRQAHAFHP